MNLRIIGYTLRAAQDAGVFATKFGHDIIIDIDTETRKFEGEHTDDDFVTLHMPNGDKWRIQMEKIN